MGQGLARVRVVQVEDRDLMQNHCKVFSGLKLGAPSTGSSGWPKSRVLACALVPLDKPQK